MDQQLKMEWVEALRSGKYKQGKSYLKSCDGTAHCCLGVLAELYVAKGKGEWNVYGEDDPRNPTITIEGKKDFDPDAFLPEATLDERTQLQLSKMNDEGGKSFSEIADYIEVNL